MAFGLLFFGDLGFGSGVAVGLYGLWGLVVAVFLCHIEVEAAFVGFSDFYICHSQQVLGVGIARIEVVGSQQQLDGLLVVAFVV